MDYSERLQNVSVLGAAGKMGSGILLLTALEMADLSLKPENKGKVFTLNAIDVSQEALSGLLRYTKGQVLKAAEKKIVQLRKVYADRADLIENIDVINEYIMDVLKIIVPSTYIQASYRSSLIFEAIKEDPDLKVKIFKQINENNPLKPWFFTNTSSIPITNIDKTANLDGRILGVHFYNPPAIQKLVEIIKGEGTQTELEIFAIQYSKNLRKVVVPSNDFAGFIGNGHFMRDALYGIHESEKLATNMPLHEAIYIINKVTQDYLVRPMGIFQLIDYVGVEVCQYIMSVMNPYLSNEDLHSDLLDKMVNAKVLGGQNSDGSQKDGFLKYEKGKPVAIYDIAKAEYVAIEQFKAKCDEKMGALNPSAKPWKAVVGSADKNEILTKHFGELKALNATGAKLAVNYGVRSCEIGKKLVADHVAMSDNDVNTVMLTGFFHAYGPINNYFNN